MKRKDERIESLVREIYELGAVKRDMWRRAGFEQAQRIAVLAVVRRGGPVRVSAVAEDLHVDVSVASRQLAALEVDGHVERTSDPGDGRSCLLAITPAGEQTLSAAHERMVGAFSATVADWTVSDLATLTALLARLRGDYARSVSEARAQPEPAVAGGPR